MYMMNNIWVKSENSVLKVYICNMVIVNCVFISYIGYIRELVWVWFDDPKIDPSDAQNADIVAIIRLAIDSSLLINILVFLLKLYSV